MVHDSLHGQIVELDIGAIAHGGHCVARLDGPHGRVVFVRHALPGETARVRITEDAGKGFCRGDAVEILVASPSRVPAPCPHAGPGRCGGCDFQHVDPGEQRRLKSRVVAEQFARLAAVDVGALTVEALPGGPLGWRRRIEFAVDEQGRVGLRRHRSHQLEVVGRCLIGAPGVGDADELRRRWPGTGELDISTDGAQRSVLTRAAAAGGRAPDGRRRPRPARAPARHVSGTETARHVVTHDGTSVDFQVAVDGFWQGHPNAASTFVGAVLSALAPQPGERVLDLYAGAGLFTAFLAAAVGVTGEVTGLEGSGRAAADAAINLAPWPWASVRAGSVDAPAVRSLGRTDLVVLDPPRTGAGREVMEAVLDSGARAVAYVACDPAALARDVRTALDAGWRLAGLRAFDAFPMTHHVECVARLLPPTDDRILGGP